MSQWRRTAIEKFPRLHRALSEAENAGWVWYELLRALEETYRQRPLDEKFVAEVYGYASWCVGHRSIEVRSAVVLWFYEHLSENELVRADMARWMSTEEFRGLFPILIYHIDKEDVANFAIEFAARKAERAGVASRTQRHIVRKSDTAKHNAGRKTR